MLVGASISISGLHERYHHLDVLVGDCDDHSFGLVVNGCLRSVNPCVLLVELGQ